MSLQVEKMEKNMAKLTIEVAAEDLEKAMQNAYQKAKGRISIPGFRKGKAPRKMIEQMYGKGVFLEDAVNALIPEHYSKALAECELEIVSQPTIDITQAEPGKAFIFTAEVAVKPEVTLGDYKGVEVPKTEITVTDEDVEAELKKEQEKNSRTISVEDRAAQLNDIVTIDFEGSVDGVPFDGGQATEYPLTLGSNTFIPGFEEQLVGAKVGDDVDVKVTFPEEYQAKELAGKEAIFKCAVKKIEAKELPELDDDFAKDVSEFDTLAEYKEHVKTNLEDKKADEAKRAKEDAAVDKAIENAQMDIPEAMLMTQCRQMLDDFSRRMQSQGLSMDQYFQFTGMTADKMMEDMKPQALKRIQTRLVLEKVAEVENIQPTEEEVNEEISKMAEAYKMEADKLKELLGERELEQMKKDMAVQKAVTVIAEASLPFCHYLNSPLILLSQADKIIRFATCLIWLKFFLQKCKRFFILKEMHKLICTHDCYIFFTQNPLYFFSVSKYNFYFFGVFLCIFADLTFRISVNSCAGFICHANRCEIRFLKCRIYFQRCEFQSCFLVHFSYCTLMEFFVRFYQTCREFVDISANCVSVLTY